MTNVVLLEDYWIIKIYTGEMGQSYPKTQYPIFGKILTLNYY